MDHFWIPLNLLLKKNHSIRQLLLNVDLPFSCMQFSEKFYKNSKGPPLGKKIKQFFAIFLVAFVSHWLS